MKNIINYEYKSAVITALFLFATPTFASALGKIVENAKSKVENRRSTSSVEQSPIGSHSFGIGLGQTFLTGDFGENGEDSITIDLYYNMRI